MSKSFRLSKFNIAYERSVMKVEGRGGMPWRAVGHVPRNATEPVRFSSSDCELRCPAPRRLLLNRGNFDDLFPRCVGISKGGIHYLLGGPAGYRESFRVFTFRTCFMTQPVGRATYCQSKAKLATPGIFSEKSLPISCRTAQ